MDRGFFRSKEFIITSCIVAVLLVGALAVGSGVVGDETVRQRRGCSVDLPAGADLAAVREDSRPQIRDGRAERVVAYTLADAPEGGTGTLALCTSVGHLVVSPSADGVSRLVFTITNIGPAGADAVERAEVEAAFRNDGGRLGIAAWVDRSTTVESTFFGGQSTVVRVELEVPAERTYRVDAHTDVGDVTLSSLSLSRLVARTDVGDIEGEALRLSGALDAATDVGDVELAFTSLETAHWAVSTDVGHVELVLPGSRDTGYEVSARSDVGHVELELGSTEHYQEQEDGPSERVEARTTGFAERPARITIDARTDVGSITITAT